MSNPEKEAVEERDAESLRRGFVVQLRCLDALMVRDLMKRYGRGNLGFFWILIEPMILTVGVMFMWSAMKGSQDRGIDVVVLVLTGYMPLTLWRHLTNAGVFALRASASLLYHRHVTPLDSVMSRLVLEFAGTTAALFVVTGVLMTAGLIAPIHDLGLAVLAWFCMGLLSFAVALIICALTEWSEVWERFIAPFQYLMLPISGAFFMLDWMPPQTRQYFLYNPTVHIFEAFRHGFIGDDTQTYHNLLYPFAYGLITMLLGMWLLERARNHLHFN
jgi:capsular polysaccharide transport system permease protein